jgi:hypothetical protein
MIKLSAAIIMMGSIFGLYKTEYGWPSYAIAGTRFMQLRQPVPMHSIFRFRNAVLPKF